MACDSERQETFPYSTQHICPVWHLLNINNFEYLSCFNSFKIGEKMMLHAAEFEFHCSGTKNDIVN